jgi:hypothetical protein
MHAGCSTIMSMNAVSAVANPGSTRACGSCGCVALLLLPVLLLGIGGAIRRANAPADAQAAVVTDCFKTSSHILYLLLDTCCRASWGYLRVPLFGCWCVAVLLLPNPLLVAASQVREASAPADAQVAVIVTGSREKTYLCCDELSAAAKPAIKQSASHVWLLACCSSAAACAPTGSWRCT